MPVRTPVATYRFQFNGEFPLDAALRLVPYLESLGITDLYASPLFQARAGSTHGYDATDYGRLNPLLGAPEDLARLAGALRARGMGLLLDLVPNHMGIADPSNAWWEDVLTNGEGSRYARYFDIDWRPPDEALRGKVLLPVLGAPLAEVLARGELKPALEGDRPVIRYFDRPFPVSPESTDALRELIADGRAGGKELESILSAQHYVLAYWRDGLRRINYRRFFDISHLAGLRVEDPEVFAAVHAEVFRWVGEGWVTGVRIDHPDGLADPTGYFRDLQAGCARAAGSALPGGGDARALYVVAEKILAGEERLRDDWAVHGTTGYEFLNDLNGLFVDPQGARAIRISYSRITGSDVPFDDFARACKREVLESRFPAELAGLVRRLAALPRPGRDSGAPSEPDLRAALIAVIACFPVYRTYLRRGDAGFAAPEQGYVREAFAAARARHAEVSAAAFDFVARAIDPAAPPDSSSDEGAARLDFVVRFQQLTAPIMAKGVEDTLFYRHVALLSLNEVGGEPAHAGVSPGAFHARNAHRRARWPDGLLATSTHDTKRGEDTRARVDVLTEMPETWEAAVGRWRELNRGFRRAVDGGLAPDANEEYLLYQTIVGAWPLTPPDGAARERFAGRIREFMRKALREAKVHTRWIDAREDYEAAVDGFVQDILGGAGAGPFIDDLERFHDRIAWPGALNSLSQLVLKIASPGVPDFYQGTEFWDFRLVDPDNRRPVDYAARRAAVEALEGEADRGALAARLLHTWRDGRIKLHVMRAALAHRRANAALYARGDYLPLTARGAQAGSVCGFARAREGAWCVAAAGRMFTRVAEAGGRASGEVTGRVTGEAWGDARIDLPETAPCHWIDQLTGAAIETDSANGAPTLPLRDVFRTLPVALLAPR
ncbi:MAG: malto-oligosyltrehalose synthase [Deltaproteobacteria bacterium]|nr:malto-oligosyltrehalose synthase [Deltaproteobacteria bacterium]